MEKAQAMVVATGLPQDGAGHTKERVQQYLNAMRQGVKLGQATNAPATMPDAQVQQIVTNILGPRVMGMAVGIHPLEALLAVLIGYPLGGLLGAFLAVPLMGIVHILIREAYAYFVLGQEMPSAPVPEPQPEQPVVALTKPLAGPGQPDSTVRKTAG